MKQQKYLYLKNKSKLKHPKGTILFIPGIGSRYGSQKKLFNLLTDYDNYYLCLPEEFEYNSQIKKKDMKKLLTHPRMVDYTINFIKAKKLKDLILIGHCEGAAIAAYVENKCSDKIKKMIFVSPVNNSYFLTKDKVLKCFPYTNIDELLQMSHLCYRLRKGNLNTEYLNKSKETIAACVKHYDKIWFMENNLVYNRKSMNQINKAITNIKTPTLVCLGKYDKISQYNEALKELKKILPKAKYVTFNKSAHMAFDEEPDKFVKVINEFIKH